MLFADYYQKQNIYQSINITSNLVLNNVFALYIHIITAVQDQMCKDTLNPAIFEGLYF